MTDPKNFLGALLAPIYTNFEGAGARAEKKAIFWSNFSKKCLKTPFWPILKKKIACGAEVLTKTGTF